MINEGLTVSKTNTYKTIINRIGKYLLSTKNYVGYRHKRFSYSADDTLYDISFSVDLDIIPVRFVTEENSDNLYIMLEYKAIPKSDKIEMQWGGPSENIRNTKDAAACILSAALNKGERYRTKISPDFSADISSDDAVKRLTYNDFKNSKAYQKIKSYVDDLASTQIQCEMPYSLYKRIKNRKNVIPVCWISNKDNRFYYISSRNWSSDKGTVNRNCLSDININDLISSPNRLKYMEDWCYNLDWDNWVVPVKDSVPHCTHIW